MTASWAPIHWAYIHWPLARGGGFGTSKQNIPEINLAHICSGCEYEGSQCFLSACCV